MQMQLLNYLDDDVYLIAGDNNATHTQAITWVDKVNP